MSWRSRTYDELPALSVRGPELRSNLRIVTVAWMYGIVWMVCIGGSHAYSFCRILGFNDFYINLLAAIPCLATFSQLVAAILIERTGLRKHHFMQVSILYRLLWIPIGLLPLLMFIPPGAAERLAGREQYVGSATPAVLVVLGLLGVAWTLESLARPAWMTWMGDLIPRRIRGRYFAQRARRSQVVSIFAVTIVSLAMIYNWECWELLNRHMGLGLADAPETRARMLLYTISGVFCIGAVFGTVDIALFSRIRELLPPKSEPEYYAPKGPTLLSVLVDPLRDRVFRRYAAYGATLTFSVTVSASFYFLFCLERMGFNQLATNLLFLALAPLADIFTSRAWGRATDRWGRRPVLIVATLLTIVSAVPFFFATRSTPHPQFLETGVNWLSGQIGSLWGEGSWKWITPGVPVGAYLLCGLGCLIGGASWSGLNLAQNSVILGFADRAGGSKCVAAASVLTSLGGVAGGVAGGAIAQWLRDMPQLTCFLWGNYHVCFLASILVRGAGIAWLWGMPDPGSAPVRVLLQQMRANLYSTLYAWFSYPVRILGWSRENERDQRRE